MPEIPDRLSVEISSPFYDRVIANMIDVYFNGIRQTDTAEYCISEGWIKRYARTGLGLFKKERGKIMTIKITGKVEVVWK